MNFVWGTAFNEFWWKFWGVLYRTGQFYIFSFKKEINWVRLKIVVSSLHPSRRHKGSNYDSHRRSYQRDDAEYSSSRYSHKHSKGYSSRRSGYWKGGSDYSSSSHRKYSDRSRRSRSSSREKSSRRSWSEWKVYFEFLFFFS